MAPSSALLLLAVLAAHTPTTDSTRTERREARSEGREGGCWRLGGWFCERSGERKNIHEVPREGVRPNGRHVHRRCFSEKAHGTPVARSGFRFRHGWGVRGTCVAKSRAPTNTVIGRVANPAAKLTLRLGEGACCTKKCETWHMWAGNNLTYSNCRLIEGKKYQMYGKTMSTKDLIFNGFTLPDSDYVCQEARVFSFQKQTVFQCFSYVFICFPVLWPKPL